MNTEEITMREARDFFRSETTQKHVIVILKSCNQIFETIQEEGLTAEAEKFAKMLENDVKFRNALIASLWDEIEEPGQGATTLALVENDLDPRFTKLLIDVLPFAAMLWDLITNTKYMRYTTEMISLIKGFEDQAYKEEVPKEEENSNESDENKDDEGGN